MFKKAIILVLKLAITIVVIASFSATIIWLNNTLVYKYQLTQDWRTILYDNWEKFFLEQLFLYSILCTLYFIIYIDLKQKKKLSYGQLILLSVGISIIGYNIFKGAVLGFKYTSWVSYLDYSLILIIVAVFIPFVVKFFFNTKRKLIA